MITGPSRRFPPTTALVSHRPMPRVIAPVRLPKHFDAPAAEARWDAERARRGVYAYDPARPREEAFVVGTPAPPVPGSRPGGAVCTYVHTDDILRQHAIACTT